MKFGPVPLDEAADTILAHSVSLPKGRLKKGTRLGPAEIAWLREAGIGSVIAARLGAADVPEDDAAARIVRALAPEPSALGLTASAPFTGRLNLYAATAGVFRVETEAVAALNALDESITLATLASNERVAARQMVATVKIIPYAAPEAAVAEAERLLGAAGAVLRVHPVMLLSAGLILTQTPGMKPSVIEKGAEAVRARLRALGIALAGEAVVPHEQAAIAAALSDMPGEMVLLLTASATSDRADVGPGAVAEAGGRLIRFGMPVDPGNLLFLGDLSGRPVIGLPGCARSPKLNGADWVLERVACGIAPTAAEIAGMGVGGLLKEIPSRPAPRTGEPRSGHRPRIAALILAAGASARMGGRDKLLEPVDGEPLLCRVARAAGASGADAVLAVLRPGDPARRAALEDQGLMLVENPRADEGMGTSIAAGVAALPAEMDGVLIVMGDMPDLTGADLDRLIAAFDPAEGRSIVRATAEDGRPGHPVLFGRRFFEPLRALGGDRGARDVVREHSDFVVDVALKGDAAVTDLDTPADWSRWRGGTGDDAA